MPRTDLYSRLDRDDYAVALVAAPAGFGKTATLASWAVQQPHDFAWLSCDASDAEPSRFMAGLLASISLKWPGAADDALVLLEREGAQTYDAAVAVANELGSVDTPGIILVDDLHLAKPAPQLLSGFLDAMPDQFRLVFGSRADLPISLARRRLHGGVLELRSDDLRFSAHHMADFSQLHGLSLDADELASLHGLTEGWPAGALLAILALHRTTDRAGFFEAFAGTDRAIGDFLLTEVLDSLPADLVDFLVDTSVLTAFDADLCAEVSGREDAAMLLDRLIATDMFVVPLDDSGSWNRYHHLFGAFLRARLASLGEARWREVHGRATRALEARGDVTGALQHAMTVGDVDRVGRVLRGALDRNMSMSDAAVTQQAIRSWLHEFGGSLIDTDPETVVEFLIGLISIAGPDDALWWLDRVDLAHPNPNAELAALLHGARCELHLYNGCSAAALRHALAGLEVLGGRPPNKGLLPLIATVVVRSHLQAGDIDAARGALVSALGYHSGNAVVDEIRHPALGAVVAAHDGELTRATQLAADVKRRADGLQLGIREPGRIWAGMARAAALLERNELADAAAAIEAVRAAADAAHRSAAALQQARVARALGDPDAAAAMLLEARLLLASPDAGTQTVFALEAVHQALRFEPAKAGVLIDALEQDRVETQVMRARLLLVDRHPREAAALLLTLPPATSRRLRVERDMLHSLAWLSADVDRANDHLRDALLASHPERLVRSIIDPGLDVHRLLMSCTPTAELQPYVDDLIDAASSALAPRRADTIRALVDPLSAREVTVLRYLCSRLTYEEIAAGLYVSPNTLKTHVKSIYRKLGVASRAEAVSTGRALRVV